MSKRREPSRRADVGSSYFYRNLVDVHGKLWNTPLGSIVPELEHYPRNPRLDAQVGGTRVAQRMRQAIDELVEETGVRKTDLVRLGLAEMIKRSQRG